MLNQNKSVNLLPTSQKKELNMKKLLGLCAGALLIMPFTLQAEGYSNSGNSATGPSVECHLPDGTKDYMPVVFCQHNNGTYHL